MEEQFMFGQIHEALDIPTPPGAYERLRVELTKKPVQHRRWPVFHMRTSDMRFRLAAGLAIVAIAVAAAAAVLAVHNASNNVSPAGSRMSIQAYKDMINRDSPDPNKVWTAQCDDTAPTASGCQTDAARSIPLLQKWMNDVKGARTPSRFIIIDAELRQHLAQSLSGLNQLEADAAAGNKPAMASDYVVAVYGADWTGTVVPLILQSQEVRATGYKNIVAIQKHELDLCLTTCTILVSSQAQSCVTNGGAPCLQMFDEMAVYFAMIAGMLVRDAAPQSLGAKDSKLQGDLAAADAVLLRMRLAVAHGDQAGINSGIDQVIRIGGRIDQDAADIANS